MSYCGAASPSPSPCLSHSTRCTHPLTPPSADVSLWCYFLPVPAPHSPNRKCLKVVLISPPCPPPHSTISRCLTEVLFSPPYPPLTCPSANVSPWCHFLPVPAFSLPHQLMSHRGAIFSPVPLLHQGDVFLPLTHFGLRLETDRRRHWRGMKTLSRGRRPVNKSYHQVLNFFSSIVRFISKFLVFS